MDCFRGNKLKARQVVEIPGPVEKLDVSTKLNEDMNLVEVGSLTPKRKLQRSSLAEGTNNNGDVRAESLSNGAASSSDGGRNDVLRSMDGEVTTVKLTSKSPRLGNSNNIMGSPSLKPHSRAQDEKTKFNTGSSTGSGLLSLNITSSSSLGSGLFRVQRLDSVEMSALGRKVFCDFLNRCYSNDVLEFWDLTSEFLANCKRKKVNEAGTKLANRIIQEFIVPDASQKMDLGYTVETPLLEAFCLGVYSVTLFDPARSVLWKLLLGLQMDASVTFGIKSSTAQNIQKFIESEERRMHQLRFQRDVNPFLSRRSRTVSTNSPALKD